MKSSENVSYDQLQERINLLKNRKLPLQEKIELYNYYTRGSMYSKLPDIKPLKTSALWINPDVANSKFYEDKMCVPKCDTAPETIASDGVAAFTSAFLPEGIRSIEVNYFDSKYKNYMRLSDAQKTAINNLSGLLTKKLQYSLERQDYDFQAQIFKAIGYYIEYGFCAVKITEDGIVNYDPTLTFYSSPINRKEEYNILLLGEETNNYEIEKKYPSTYKRNKPRKKYTKLFRDGSLGIQNIIYSFFERQQNDMWLEVVYEDNSQQVLDVIEHNVTCPVFVASQEHKVLDYGLGDGITALSPIIGLNYMNKAIRTASMLMTNPPLIIEEKAQLKMQKQDGTVQQGLDVRPEGITFINSLDGSSSQGSVFPAVDPKTVDIGAFQNIYLQFRAEIEKAFSADLFSAMPANEKTATEVNTRTAQAYHKFNGKANNFYRNVLIPIVRFYANLLIKIEVDKKQSGFGAEVWENLQPVIGKDYEDINSFLASFTVELISFEKQMNKDRDIANSMQYMQIMSAIAQSGVEFDAKDKLNNIIKIILDRLEITAGV